MRRQCKACPWKVSTVPARDIAGGYSAEKHRNLRSTIAEPGALSSSDALHIMACHESRPGAEVPCVGWLANQLGSGNNLRLRLLALDGRFNGFELDGEQHERLEDTLPDEQ